MEPALIKLASTNVAAFLDLRVDTARKRLLSAVLVKINRTHAKMVANVRIISRITPVSVSWDLWDRIAPLM